MDPEVTFFLRKEVYYLQAVDVRVQICDNIVEL